MGGGAPKREPRCRYVRVKMAARAPFARPSYAELSASFDNAASAACKTREPKVPRICQSRQGNQADGKPLPLRSRQSGCLGPSRCCHVATQCLIRRQCERGVQDARPNGQRISPITQGNQADGKPLPLRSRQRWLPEPLAANARARRQHTTQSREGERPDGNPVTANISDATLTSGV